MSSVLYSQVFEAAIRYSSRSSSRFQMYALQTGIRNLHMNNFTAFDRAQRSIQNTWSRNRTSRPGSGDLADPVPSQISNSPKTDGVDLDAPIQYTTSKASTWTAARTHHLEDRNMPWFQPSCVIVPIVAFLIWFGILREENDIDAEMSKSLWERIPGLEIKQLKNLINHNRSIGLDSADLEARLKVLEAKAVDGNHK